MLLYRVLLLLIPGIYWLIPLIIDLWQQIYGPWYQPFIAWLVVIVLAYIADRRRFNG